MQLEVKADKKARKEEGRVDSTEAEAGWGGGQLGAIGDWFWERVPPGKRAEVGPAA